MQSFETQDTNQKLVIVMLVQAINQGKNRRALEQQRLELRIAQQARDEFQRCYNAHDKLLDEKDAEIERLLRKNRSLEDYVQDAAEKLMEEEEEPDVWPFFLAWREEVGERESERERELERIRSIPMPGLYELEGVNYANEDPW